MLAGKNSACCRRARNDQLRRGVGIRPLHSVALPDMPKASWLHLRVGALIAAAGLLQAGLSHYRFLFVAEDRDLLLDPHADNEDA